jgi:ATP-dependent protease ClpP protease subunit
MEVNLNTMKRRRSSTLYEYPADMMKSKKDKVMFGGNMNKDASNNDDDDGDEPGIDFTKLFKKQSPEENSYIVDNNIYFTDDITMDTMNKLIKQIRSLEKKLLLMSMNLNIEPPPIRLTITSSGGSIIAALKCINLIKSLKVEIHSIIDSYAASAATLISVVCDKRYMNKYSSILIHELRSQSSWNKMSELEDEMTNLKKVMDQIKDIYAEHTNLTRSTLSKILKRDLEWTPQEALEHGLIDEINE